MTPTMPSLDFIMAFEDGTASDREVIDGFANLVASGMAWRLQGVYGRTAKSLIDAGYIDADGNVLRYPEDDL